MTAVANEWYRWFTLAASEVELGEHFFFRFAVTQRHAVTLVENNVLCFVCPEDSGVSQQSNKRTYNAHSIALRVRKALTQEVWVDSATWAVSICIALAQGPHIHTLATSTTALCFSWTMSAVSAPSRATSSSATSGRVKKVASATLRLRKGTTTS